MVILFISNVFFFSSRRRHTRFDCDWSSDVCSSDLCGLRGDEIPTGARILAVVDCLDGLARSEEHTSELQSQSNLVCRLLLEKKKTRQHTASPGGSRIRPQTRCADRTSVQLPATRRA